MNIYILSHTENPFKTIYSAYRQCYSSGTASDIFHDEDVTAEQMVKTIRKGIRSGHLSPLEHVSFTFSVEGVSRALTHQLVRHRMASYSQQSQRYVNVKNNGYYIPNAVHEKQAAYEAYVHAVRACLDAYNELVEMGIPIKDARYLLPNAMYSNIVVTMNCRELLHFFEERCCSRAQNEINILAWNMLYSVNRILPAAFEDAGPKCKRLGYCPEEKGCGFAPKRDDVFGISEQLKEEENGD